MRRYLEKEILRDISKKMVFLGGPRQVGKTTMAKQIIKDFPYEKSKKGLYLNWDFDEDQENIIQKRWDDIHQLIVFDELHKYRRWKNWIKGIYGNYSHLQTGISPFNAIEMASNEEYLLYLMVLT